MKVGPARPSKRGMPTFLFTGGGMMAVGLVPVLLWLRRRRVSSLPALLGALVWAV